MNKYLLVVRDTESSLWTIMAQTDTKEKMDTMVDNLRSDPTDQTPFLVINTADYIQV